MAMQVRLERVAGLFSEGNENASDQYPCENIVALDERRRALLHETRARRLSRLTQVLWHLLHPACLSSLIPAFDLIWREKTMGAEGLPVAENALAKPDGLCGLAPDLSSATLATAFARGLHPRCTAGPATFWAPAQRMILHPAGLKLSTSQRGHLHKGGYDVAFDRNFEPLIAACAAPGPDHARLSPKLLKAHIDLFDAGMVHSFAVHDRAGRLAGGGYGMAVGRSFVLERWFEHVPGAAKLGLAVLARHLANWDFRLLDGTMVPALVEAMGFKAMPRMAYNSVLASTGSGGKPGRWRVDPALYAPRSNSTAARHLFDPPRQSKPLPQAVLRATQVDLFQSLGLDLPALSVGDDLRKQDDLAA